MRLFIFAVLLAGCGQSDREPRLAGSAPQPTRRVVDGPPVPPEKPVAPVNPKLAAFRDGMAKFIEEARSVTRAMELVPDRAVYHDRVVKLQEVYSRIPDTTDPALLACREKAKDVATAFGLGTVQLGVMEHAVRIGDKKIAAECVAEFKGFGVGQKRELDELEAAVAEGRAPKESPDREPKK